MKAGYAAAISLAALCVACGNDSSGADTASDSSADDSGDTGVNDPPEICLPEFTDTHVKITSSGGSPVCSVSDAGRLRCWGGSSPAGSGTGIDYNSGSCCPEVSPLQDVSDVDITGTSASPHVCAISDGRVFCWGKGDFGGKDIWPEAATVDEAGWTLGDDEPADAFGPITLPEKAVDIAVADRAACAVLESGSVYCWGGGGGYLPRPQETEFEISPFPVGVGFPAGGVEARGAELGFCAWQKDGGSVRCWGRRPETSECQFPPQTPGLEVGEKFGGSADVDEHDALTFSSPIVDMDISGDILGGEIACVQLASEEVYCWGPAFSSDQEPGCVENLSTPEAEALNIYAGSNAVAGASSTLCALVEDGEVVCDDRLSLKWNKQGVQGKNVRDFFSDGDIACTILDGAPRCWGTWGGASDWSERLGYGFLDAEVSAPVDIPRPPPRDELAPFTCP